jgi:hypothetical protein
MSGSSSSGFESFSGSASKVVDVKEPSLLHFNMTSPEGSEEMEDGRGTTFDLFPRSEARLVEVKGPTALSLGTDETSDVIMDDSGKARFQGLKPSASTSSHPSDRQLSMAFKFGGVPKATAAPSPAKPDKPVTLSDIMPPPSHFRPMSDGSVRLTMILSSSTPLPRPWTSPHLACVSTLVLAPCGERCTAILGTRQA